MSTVPYGPYETIEVTEHGDGILVCAFARPEVRNALNQQMVDDLHALFRALHQDRTVQVLILTGQGKAFLSGADIAELKERDRYDALRKINNGVLMAVEQLPCVTIAAVNGYALGGGCEMAAACDLRVVAEGARMGQPEVKLGIMPGAGATYRLPRLIGLGNARDLVLTGRIVDAPEAYRMGLANRIEPDDTLLDGALSLAREIASNGPLAVRFSKAALNASPEMSAQGGMALETTVQALLFEDQDKHARMQAFLDKKKAR